MNSWVHETINITFIANVYNYSLPLSNKIYGRRILATSTGGSAFTSSMLRGVITNSDGSEAIFYFSQIGTGYITIELYYQKA